jgi:hypothetical protein
MCGQLKRTAAGILVGTGLALALGSVAALADRGAIVPVGPVNIEEPAQRAIIAYDGLRELLILQTDVKADRETKVVEFMPLPSKPHVSLAPEGCFAALQEIVTAHHLQYIIPYRGEREGGAAGAEEEAVKVVVAEQIGPHEVTVVEVKDADELMRWVVEFFRQKGLGEPALREELRQVVSDYLQRGLRFFAFDILSLSPERKTVQPLAYDFETECLYYPLKVTNLYGGTGTIELLTVVPRRLAGRVDAIHIWPHEERGARPAPWRFLRSTWTDLTPEEMARLHRDIPKFIGDGPGLLRAVRYEGPLHFDNDVWVPPEERPKRGAD